MFNSSRDQQIREIQEAMAAFTGAVEAVQIRPAAKPEKLRKGEAMRRIYRAGYEGRMAAKAGKGGKE